MTATSYAHRDHGQRNAVYLQALSWIMQFIGHGAAEGRSPALLDNFVGGWFLCDHVLHCILTLLSSCVPGSLFRSSRGMLKFIQGSRSFDHVLLVRYCSSSATVKTSTRSSKTVSELRLPSSGRYRETKPVLVRKIFEGRSQMIHHKFLQCPQRLSVNMYHVQ